MRKVFTCPCCHYKSNRQFNVLRHERRIHSRNHTRICCGEVLLSKAEYYAHCELYHPKARAHTYISKDKYKITADSLVFEHCDRRSSGQERPSTKESRPVYNFRVRRKYSGSIRTTRKERNVNSKLSMNYSLTYSGLDIEDIPLICFIKNQESNHPVEVAVSSDCREENNNIEEDIGDDPPLTPRASTESECLTELNRFKFQREFKGEIESTEEEASWQNDGQNEPEVAWEPTSPISPTALPAKKLILHRFKASFQQEFNVNLRDANNNCQQMNITKASRESVTRLLQTVNHKGNKENVSSYEFSVTQQLNIKLDQGVTVPLATQMHRDFLDMIDFESYKIF